MVLLIRLLRPVAYLIGIAGALLVLNAQDPRLKNAGWILVAAMVPVFVAVTVLSSIALARQKARHRRR